MKKKNNTISKESGFSLFITIIFSFIISIFVIVYLYNLMQSNENIGNGNLNIIEKAALNYGGREAANVLNSYPNWPELLSNPQYFSPDPVSGGQTQTPSMPDNTYWNSCTSASNPCGSLQKTENGITLNIEFILYPANGLSQQLSAYQQSGSVKPTERFYLAFVHVSNKNNTSVTNEVFLLRKVLM